MTRPSWCNTPNAISATRFPLALLFVTAGSATLRVVVVAVSALSDWIDGKLARDRQQVTRTGEVLDPIADRAFMITVLVTLAVERTIPLWTLPLLLLRDAGVILGAAAVWAVRPRARLEARRPGKRVTWLQFAAAAAILLWPPLARWVAPAIALLGVIALVDYGRVAAASVRATP